MSESHHHHSSSTSHTHHTTIPESIASCACCWEDISPVNFAEYLPHPSAENNFHPHYLPALYCQDCIEHLLKSQWSNYTEALSKTTCKAEQRRLLTRGKWEKYGLHPGFLSSLSLSRLGPPINLRDDKALPCPNNGEVHKLWYMNGNVEKIAKLEYSLEGEVSMIRIHFHCLPFTHLVY